jgi:prepilin-type N-terminal cleavage/methylation domain-containing protein
MNQKGYTLIELIVTLVVVSMILKGCHCSYDNVTKKAKAPQRREQLFEEGIHRK